MRGILLLCIVLATPAGASQTPASPPNAEDLSIQAFLQAVETAISTSDRARWLGLQSSNADRDQALEFFDAMVPQGVTRVVVKERDRSSLAGALPGEGFRLVTEVFIETGPRGRIATWRLDIRRPRGDELERQPWRVIAQDRLSSIEGIHRLSLSPDKQFAAHDLVLKAVDFELRLPAGQVFEAETPEGVTALVLIGDGSMLFAPAPKEEKGQVRLFTGNADTVESAFGVAFVRISPFEFDQIVSPGMLTPEATDPRAYRRALQVFEDEIGNSFSLDLSDLSRDTWSLLPQPGDFIAEVRTRKYDALTYARASAEAEDVTLFQRGRKRNISIYASEQKLASRGRTYDEDDLVEYDITDYNVDAAFSPARDWLEGRARIKIRVKAFALGVLTLKLADALTVNSVTSDELGRLLFLRVRNQNSIVVNLPSPVPRDFQMTLSVSYQGRIDRQAAQDESVALEGDEQRGQARVDVPDDLLVVPPEPHWLFSNRAQWYPQAPVTDYATATIRMTVPAEYAVAGSGVPVPGSPMITGMIINGQGGNATYVFRAQQPIRYLGVIVSKMSRVDAATVALDIVPPPAAADASGPSSGAARPTVPAVGMRNTTVLTIYANRRQEGRAREMFTVAADILRQYADIMGDVPYDAITVTMLENDLPGGHAPGYFAVINNTLPMMQTTWRNDPATFSGFPEFFMAHELAHQWFGQAVGWKNYHEQWLSEGLAQYFAALVARERHGEPAFRDMLKQMRRWAMDESDQGPIFLGYRLGHIRSEPRVFRALVYNKGAMVLHMLRRLVGDQAFFGGLRRYYADNRFKKAGTSDLQKAFEAASGRNLSRFFQQWIFDVDLPRLRVSSTVAGSELVVRVDQTAGVFDVPLTISIQYADGKMVDDVVVVSEATVEKRIPLAGAVRGVEFNQDNGALVTIDRR